MSPVPKAGYTDGLGCITPLGNANAFPDTPFGWFCPHSVSLLAYFNVPLSALLNAWRCERLWCYLALLFFVRERSC